jgi:hypothetical protein
VECILIAGRVIGALLRRLAANGVGLEGSGIYASYFVQMILHKCFVQTGARL